MKRNGPELVKINISIEKFRLDRIKEILVDPELSGHGTSVSDFLRRAATFYDLKMVEPNYSKEKTAAGQIKRKKLDEVKAFDSLDPEVYAREHMKALIGTVTEVGKYTNEYPLSVGMRVAIVHGLSNGVKAIPLDKIKVWKEENEMGFEIHMAALNKKPVPPEDVKDWHFETNYGKVELDDDVAVTAGVQISNNLDVPDQPADSGDPQAPI